MPLIFDSLNREITLTLDHTRNIIGLINRKPKKWYNKKTSQTRKKLKTLINLYFYELEKTKSTSFFITITTNQHKTGKSDTELYSNFQSWVKYHRLQYISIVERQRDTGDLHFHVLAHRHNYRFKFKREIKRLSKLFGTNQHPSRFDCKRVPPIFGKQQYIKKYIAEYSLKKSSQYTSLFRCRTFSYSRDIGKLYNQYEQNFVTKLAATTSEKSTGIDFFRLVNLKRVKIGIYYTKYLYKPQYQQFARNLLLNQNKLINFNEKKENYES